jgi:hypothetical protein
LRQYNNVSHGQRFSAGSFLLNDKGDAAVRRVSVRLTDGTLIVGNLNSFSREVAEHGCRELVLQHPMWVQPEGGEDLIELQAAATLISARNIKSSASNSLTRALSLTKSRTATRKPLRDRCPAATLVRLCRGRAASSCTVSC